MTELSASSSPSHDLYGYVEGQNEPFASSSEKFIITTQDFPRVQLSILLLYVQIMESLV